MNAADAADHEGAEAVDRKVRNMTEILESTVLAAGVSYLGYHIYCRCFLPVWVLLRGKGDLSGSNSKQSVLSPEPPRELQDVV